MATKNTHQTHFYGIITFELAAMCSLLMLGLISFASLAADEIEVAKLDNQERIQRLQDIAINTNGWYMQMPSIQSSINRSGLQTAGYSALQKDMLEAMRKLNADPNDKLARNRLEIIKDRVENRILANLDAGYIYASGVYIEMLEDIAPGSVKIAEYKQRVENIKAFHELSQKFDSALAENRLQAPEEDCASFYLEQMRSLQFVDADKIAEAEARFKNSQQVAFKG